VRTLGKIAWLEQYRLDQVPDIEEIFAALRKVNAQNAA